jgi:hypothetical protein
LEDPAEKSEIFLVERILVIDGEHEQLGNAMERKWRSDFPLNPQSLAPFPPADRRRSPWQQLWNRHFLLRKTDSAFGSKGTP